MSLFQKSVLQNYLKFLPKEKVETAWQTFSAHFHNPIVQEDIRTLKEEQYQEGFLDDLFVKVFGYTKKPNPSYNLTTELKNIKNAKKTDGALLRSDGNPFAVIELKGMDTTDLSKVETQAFGYKNNQYNCTYVIISNFEKLRFYIDNAVDFEEFNLFTITRERFEVLYFCLSFETLLIDDRPKKAKEETLNREEEITKALYNDYADFRNVLFKNIQTLNPEHDKLTLFKKTQKLLDRFLFIFFAEDKGLLDKKLIAYIIDEWREINEKHGIPTSLYEKYKRYFHFLYTGKKSSYHNIFPYNGGLFKTDELLDSLKIDDALLARHTLKISEYDFDSDVSVNILGHIFEHSLNDFEEIQAEIEGTAFEKTTTRRKKDGVFYTPKYITKYIVDNTVGKLCQDKKTELEISEEKLEKNYEVENGKPIKNKKIREQLHQKIQHYKNWLFELTICDPACGSGAFLNQVLEFLITEHHYIYELELKLIGTAHIDTELENKILKNNIFGVDINEESIEIAKLSLWLRTAYKGRKLTTLNDNIKCGNSLIDDPKIAGEKAFNWKNEFPTVFQKGGFDVVVGNPPYVQAEQAIYSNYYTQKCSDLYAYFYEKSTKILKESSYLGFITPSLFIKGIKYSTLRDFFIENVEIVELSEKGDKVFEDVQMPTAILIFKNHKVEGQEWDNFITGSDLLGKMANDKITIGDISNIMRGLEIGKDKVFEQNNDVKFLTGSNIDRYSIKSYSYIDTPTYQKYKKDNTFFDGDRVIIRETGSRLTSVYLKEPLQQNRSLYSIKILSKFELNSLYALVILNSLVTQYFYKNKFAANTNIFPKIRISQVKELPIPNISKEEQKPFIELANKMLSLNEEFSAKKNRFLRRLEENFKLDKLTKKLDSFYESDFSVHKSELKKKKIELSFKQQDEWQDYFEDYKKELLALQHQIQTTDNQIDNLVFELYNLTKEEIELIREA